MECLVTQNRNLNLKPEPAPNSNSGQNPTPKPKSADTRNPTDTPKPEFVLQTIGSSTKVCRATEARETAVWGTSAPDRPALACVARAQARAGGAGGTCGSWRRTAGASGRGGRHLAPERAGARLLAPAGADGVGGTGWRLLCGEAGRGWPLAGGSGRAPWGCRG